MIVPEVGTDKALDLQAGSRKGAHDLLAPDLFPIEIGNSLVIAARSGRIPVTDLPVVYAELMSNLPILYQCLSLFPRAYSIASQIRVSVYDALYVALAERENCSLLTHDEMLIKAAVGFPLINLDSL